MAGTTVFHCETGPGCKSAASRLRLPHHSDAKGLRETTPQSSKKTHPQKPLSLILLGSRWGSWGLRRTTVAKGPLSGPFSCFASSKNKLAGPQASVRIISFWCFETSSYYVALADLESRLPSNSQRFAHLCVPRVGIKYLDHQA